MLRDNVNNVLTSRPARLLIEGNVIEVSFLIKFIDILSWQC